MTVPEHQRSNLGFEAISAANAWLERFNPGGRRPMIEAEIDGLILSGTFPGSVLTATWSASKGPAEGSVAVPLWTSGAADHAHAANGLWRAIGDAENDLAERATSTFAAEVLLAASYEALALQMTWIAIGVECASEHVRSTVASLRLSTQGPQTRLRADWLDSGGESRHLDHPLWARPLQPVISPGWIGEAFAMAVAGHT